MKTFWNGGEVAGGDERVGADPLEFRPMDAAAREEGFHVEQHFGVNVRPGWEEMRNGEPVAKRHLRLAIALDSGKQLDVLLQPSGV